ncbi:BCCT family transporter [Winogradskyella sp. F6397]|uniref:BCCT family transporter n=1 Tax=Winogradskyella marina TaxID=2785530 RepID=A0ABS0EHJ4_9FLAO|nr:MULTISPECIES: BCCT family transporter [Winogradskyella]MBF8149908.1 BCCT family transporter [Winogradskyella marina]
MKLKSTLSKGIFIPSMIFIIGICVLSAIFPEATNSILDFVKNYIFTNLYFIFVWSVTVFVLFLIILLFTKHGNIRLGKNNSKPEYSFFSWISMLFAAGMGIGLMYFSVAEPMQHYTHTAFSENSPVQRANDAQLFTFFHWGVHAWAIYGVVGLSLSYFAYRYRLPLSLRSCFYPLLKDRIKGKWGNIIDIFALCSTFFGITTTLGFGVLQLNSGLEKFNIVPDTSFLYQALIVIVLVSISVFSAVSGVDKGVKVLSRINILSVVVLLLFVLFLGPTVYLIGTFTEGLGSYVSSFFDLTFSTYANEEAKQPWFFDWTILYWAWWISWSPYVGIFIARISKGRTIREFVSAVLIIPTLFNFIWMSVFGNSAVWFDQNIADGALSLLADNPDALMFSFLEYLPFTEITSFLTLAIIIIFFVTSADSGIFVMNGIATRNAPKSPKWQIVTWGVLLASLALMLLRAGGLEALQSMTLITALPFAIIMLLFIISFVKALIIDQNYYERDYSISTVPWSGQSWKSRLGQIISFSDKKTTDEYIDKTVKPAFENLQKEFLKNGVNAKLNSFKDPNKIEIEVEYDLVNNFIYGVRNESKLVSDSLMNEQNINVVENNHVFFPKSYFGDEREGYDVQLFTENELISDVLKHYERFLGIVSDEKNQLFTSRNINKRMT